MSFFYFYKMKKTAFILFGFVGALLSAQFHISITAKEGFAPKEVYLFTTNGSKDMLVTKLSKTNDQWSFKYPGQYMGMMKAYFPEINYSLNFISENRDVNIKLDTQGSRVSEVLYIDESNKMMDLVQDFQRKQQTILPVLYQMKEFYKPSSAFSQAMDKEISVLTGKLPDVSKYPFITYYTNNYSKFLGKPSTQSDVSQSEIIQFISHSNEMLETSTLLRPILQDYLSTAGNTEVAVENLLKAVNLETPRGQTVLSELIEIFDTYSMTELKDKYLAEAKNLKCTINDRLASTIKSNDAVALGATFENYVFSKPVKTQARSLYEVKADKKVIVFWSSTCSHCETELPKFIPYYSQMKAKNIEIVGLSLDVDKASYDSKANHYPWINDTELRGWNSTFAEKYNVRATPTYYILDKNNRIIAKPDHIADVLENLGLK